MTQIRKRADSIVSAVELAADSYADPNLLTINAAMITDACKAGKVNMDAAAFEIQQIMTLLGKQGLTLGDQSADAYVLVLGGKLKLSINWKGWAKLCRRHGMELLASAVKEGDQFSVGDQGLKHNGNPFADGRTIGWYTVINKGGVQVAYSAMSLKDMEARKKQSKRPNQYEQWQDEMMFAKTARQACERAGLLSDVAGVSLDDDWAEPLPDEVEPQVTPEMYSDDDLPFGN